MSYNWVSIHGQFAQENETVVFRGGVVAMPDGSLGHSIGNFICDQSFGVVKYLVKCILESQLSIAYVSSFFITTPF